MFTRCPECSTVFRVTANQLRAARGDVRCGSCAYIVNAMEYLTDELPDGGVADVAEDELLADEAQDTGSMEFDAPEQTWSEFFIEAPGPPGDVVLDGELEAITADPDEWRNMLAEMGMDEARTEEPPAEEAEDMPAAANEETEHPGDLRRDQPEDQPTAEHPDWESEEEPAESIYVTDHWKLDAANDVEEADTASAEDQTETAGPAWTVANEEAAEEPLEDPVLPPWSETAEEVEDLPARPGQGGWGIAAAVLFLLLFAQLTHYSRDSLASHPRYGEMIRNLYARLDMRLFPEWPLEAFSVRRSEALAGGSAPNALDIIAAVEVAGAHPIGLPLLRVTLRDQWTNTVGSRVFLPQEYLATKVPPIVPPGTRLPVRLSLADPGTEARGYEVDLCLPRRQMGLECQRAQRPQSP